MNKPFDTMEDELPSFCLRHPVWIYCWNGNEPVIPEYPRQLKAKGTINDKRVWIDRQGNQWNHARLMAPWECSYSGCKYLEVQVESKTNNNN